MKIRKTLKKIARTEGKKSMISKKIIALKSHKEFSYLVDTTKA